MTNETQKSTNDLAAERTDLAVGRTVMAADRSLMAWVRTGLSLISFGFTIYKFLEYERAQVSEAGKALASVSSPKVIGLFMIGLGIFSLVLGTVENVMTIRSLRARYDINKPRFSIVISGVLMILGVILFVGILFHIKNIG